MRVIVTGGAGYIGSTTVRSLLKSGHEVLVFDDLSNGRRSAVPADAMFVRGDVANRSLLDSTMKDFLPQAVFHFAASIEAGESMKQPVKYFRNNTASTLTVLEAMRSNGVNKLVFSSTAALYGNPERIPIEESDALKPTNVYGESKLLVEQMLAWVHRIHGFRYASLRYFNAAGSDGESGETHEPESHLIPLILQTAAGKRESISIFGTDYATPDGTCIRDFVHVADLADAHVRALDALDSRERLIYNLGSGRGFSVRQVIESARRITGQPIKVVERPRRPGDPAVLVASSAKIRSELGWVPQHPHLDGIIASAWNWMQKVSQASPHPTVVEHSGTPVLG